MDQINPIIFLKVAVNTRHLLSNQLEGIGWFTYELFNRICKHHPEDTFYFLFDRPYSEEFVFAKNVVPVVLYPPARHPVLQYFWNEIQVGRWLNRNRPEVYVSPDGFFPLQTKIPTVAVIHDIAHQVFKGHLRKSDQFYYNKFIPRLIRKASSLVTVSNFSKSEIASRFQKDPNEIEVIYNAPRDNFKPVSDKIKLEVQREFADGHPYFLHIGAVHPRKNILTLINAFEKFCLAGNQEMHLLLVGKMRWMSLDILKKIRSSSVSDRIYHIGYQDDTTLSKLLGSAEALVSISLYEGFGIPLVEAMACKVPIVCSNTTALSEIGGSAAIQVPPENPDKIAEAFRDICDPKLKAQIIEHAETELKRFNWERSATALYRIIQNSSI